MLNLELEQIINQQLNITAIRDYAPNGLQVQGCPKINKIITGVSASQELIDYAIHQQAEAILVHHGYFWKGESPVITGIKYQRLRKLLTHNINLYAYHLPLDVHPTLGNNILFANALGIQQLLPLQTDVSVSIPMYGYLDTPITVSQLQQRLTAILQHDRIFVYAANTNNKIHKIGLCTGAGQDFIEDAVNLGCDTFITGEVSERTVLQAQEYAINFFACGHHVTERWGIEALGEWLSNNYQLLDVNFKDCYNPI